MLVTFLSDHRARIIETLCQRIRDTAPAFRQIPWQELQARVAKGVEAFLQGLSKNDMAPLDRFVAETVASRPVETFPLGVLHAAFTAFGELLVPLLGQCYGNRTSCILKALQRLHELKDAMLQRLVTQYEAQARAVFRAQREQLTQQLTRVDDAFQTLYDFNESIIQSMTSGLLVADKETHRILKVNRAMERLGGFKDTDVIGKTVEAVFADYHGLPIGEFADEVDSQGTITLRKHRLYTDDGREFYQTIKGQVFYNHRGENKGVIVIVDDISTSELVRDTFSRYLSPQVLEQVLGHKHRPGLDSVRCDLTVLFADIRNFTCFAERHEPEAVVEMLNQYLDVLVEIIFTYQGTLDKFLGDGLLALFGAPLPQPDHPLRAVQTGLGMQRAIADLNARRRRHGASTLDIGIGINTGEAIVGNIGSEKRMEYTVVGDMVNVAQRIQARARGGEILVSDTTLARTRSLVTAYKTIEERVKGRQQPVRAHGISPLVWPSAGGARLEETG